MQHDPHRSGPQPARPTPAARPQPNPDPALDPAEDELELAPPRLDGAPPVQSPEAITRNRPAAAAPEPPKPKIRAFGQGVGPRHDESWNRTPNTTGHGAIHCKTFHSKLTDDALRFLDQSINEWLDAHPEYEVKFVNSTIGTFTGKLKEPHLICQIWV